MLFRSANQLEYIRHIYEKEIKSILTESFIAINESPDKYIAELNFLSGQIINSITLEKFRCLIQREKIDVLIVPELFKDTWIEDIKKLNPAVSCLFKLVSRFSEGFAKAKAQRNILDFNDLEHFALKLLIDEKGEAAPLANRIRNRFTEIDRKSTRLNSSH